MATPSFHRPLYVFRPFEGLLAATRGFFRTAWVASGASRETLGGLLGGLWSLLGASWELLGELWAPLGQSLQLLGHSVGDSLPHLAVLGDLLGAIWAQFIDVPLI